MQDRVLLDTNIVLDYLLCRKEINPFWEKLPLYLIQHKIEFCLAAHQIATIEYVFIREAKRLGLWEKPQARLLWSLFLSKATIVKTPATFDRNHRLSQRDIEDYQIQLAAESAGCRIITRDNEFSALSDRCFPPQAYLSIAMESQATLVPFLDLKTPHTVLRSAGFGVRLLVNPIGMIGFDYGYGYDGATPNAAPPGWKFHFQFGKTL